MHPLGKMCERYLVELPVSGCSREEFQAPT